MTNDPRNAHWESPHFAPATGHDAIVPADTDIIGPRVGAAIIDFVGANIAIVLAGLAAGSAYVAVNGSYGAGGQAVVFLTAILTAMAYFILPEGAIGKTPGKALLGLRVVHSDGEALTWGGAVVRNLLRLIDGMFFYLVGFLLVVLTDMHQRLGDMAADTVVVEDMAARP